MDAHLFADDLRSQADWRRRCAERFPRDTRNAEAAALLDRIASDLSEKDVEAELSELAAANAALSDDGRHLFGGDMEEYHRQIGFWRHPDSGSAYLRALTAMARRRAA